MDKFEWIDHAESVLSTVGSYEMDGYTIHKPSLRLDYYMVFDTQGRLCFEEVNLEVVANHLISSGFLTLEEPNDSNEVKDLDMKIDKFCVNENHPTITTIHLNEACELTIHRTTEGVGLSVWDWSDKNDPEIVWSVYHTNEELTGENNE